MSKLLRQVALCIALFATALFAQSERGTITGTVRDASGAIIPGAKVVLANTQTGLNFTAPTNANGEYTVPQLQVGTYTVRVEKSVPPSQHYGPHFERFGHGSRRCDARSRYVGSSD